MAETVNQRLDEIEHAVVRLAHVLARCDFYFDQSAGGSLQPLKRRLAEREQARARENV
jgi:hypothetical protein